MQTLPGRGGGYLRLLQRPSSLKAHPSTGSSVPVKAVNYIPTSAPCEINNNGSWRSTQMSDAFNVDTAISNVPERDLSVYPLNRKDERFQIAVHTTPEAATASLAKMVLESSESAIKMKGSFTLVLSGGSLIDSLCALLEEDLQWSKFFVFFVDERNVLHSHPDSNFGQARLKLLRNVPVPDDQVYAIQEGVPVFQAATNYESRLQSLPSSVLPRNENGFPIFDLMLLGVGPDGHVASLFPHKNQLAEETNLWVLPVDDSPKPPSERITLSLPVINAAKEVAFLALGKGKAEILQQILEAPAAPGALPAQLVRLTDGKICWLLDVMSGSLLNIAA